MDELRFKKPEPIDHWQEMYNANNLQSSCPQERSENFLGFKGEEVWNPNTPISEDCLYLNLWVPTKFRRHNNNGISNATVMIWIHGGGYTIGTSTIDLYNGLTLAAMNDVIVASMNYRLGALGFLYLGTEEAPGNMGLYDQALAIQWIKDNIHFFGGNPNSVTLFGSSAGAASITAHLLSPLSSHLVKRVILQSGVVTASWGAKPADISKNYSQILAKDVGCFIEKSSAGGEILDEVATMYCLRDIDALNILNSQQSFWAPTVSKILFV